MAAISIGTSVAAGGIGAFGALSEGEAGAASARYKAGLALQNQKINKQNADWAREAGGINAMQSGLKSRQMIGETKVKQAASGFDVNAGSPAEVREAQGEAAKFDQDMIRYDASKTAYGYEVKAAGDEAESKLQERAAENAKRSGRIKAFSSILGSASSVAGKWSQANMTGMFGSGGGGSNHNSGDAWDSA